MEFAGGLILETTLPHPADDFFVKANPNGDPFILPFPFKGAGAERGWAQSQLLHGGDPEGPHLPA
jgi:hypothetical protein